MARARRATIEAEFQGLTGDSTDVSQLVAIIDRHLREEIADPANRGAFDDAGIGLGTAYRSLRSRHLIPWVVAAKPEWEFLETAREQLVLRGAEVREGGHVDTPRGNREAAVWAVRYGSKRDTLDRLVLEQLIRPELRELLNSATEPEDRDYLDIEPEGLAELPDPRYEINTASKDALLRVVGSMPGGSIGLAGPRGVGKTTIIRALCDRQAGSGSGGVSVMVSAPVRYDPREFLLTLFAKTCRSVVGDSSGDLFGDHVPRPGLGRLAIDKARGRSVPIGFVLLVVAFALSAGRFYDVRVSPFWALVTLLCTVGASLVVMGALKPVRYAAEPRDPLVLTARNLLQEIRFQQSISSSSGGHVELGLGLTAQVAATTSIEVAQRARSFPELVDQYREFLRSVVALRGSVFIGIDELDKVGNPGDAADFLNELKALFGVEGCFFIVAVSDDALAGFETRGVSVRDAFDSAFDDVLRADPLTFAESQRLLRRRVVGIPTAFAALCHALSGGIPRDLIRHARSLAAIAKDPDHGKSLDIVVGTILRGELRRRADGTIARFVRVRGGSLAEALSWIREFPTDVLDVDAVTKAGAAAPFVIDAELSVDADLRESLQSFAAYAYFLSSIGACLVGPGGERGDVPWSTSDDDEIERLASVNRDFRFGASVPISRLEVL